MIKLTQVKLPIEHTEQALKKKVGKLLRLTDSEIKDFKIIKQSLDARKKSELCFSYVIEVKAEHEEAIVRRLNNPNITFTKRVVYQFPTNGATKLTHRPVIVGMGPAGLFSGYLLAKHGYRPLLVERGESVENRVKKVEEFWKQGTLDVNSNVQFGEGGAGTFSDGKLNTLVKDPKKRNQLVLETLVEFGADPAILYQNKPHIGTDVLSDIVKRMREAIISYGGEVRFSTQVTDVLIEKGSLKKICLNDTEWIDTQAVVLAVGHSARDTFEMLHKHQVPMEAKPFAVGLRIQHPQSMINKSQYGKEHIKQLGAADYKLAKQTKSGRGVYSFCMCPGGYVVNSSSEEGMLAVNGMSYHDRDGMNANSALIVTVTPQDFEGDSPLAGVEFQRKLEKATYQCGGGKIPVQLYGDFKANRKSTKLGDITVEAKGDWAFANLRTLFSNEMNQALIEAMGSFHSIVHGFGREDAVLAGVESRTSSPIRIWRGDGFESEIKGLYPCGEGAGYAGGITSAAMDGVKVAEAIATEFKK